MHLEELKASLLELELSKKKLLLDIKSKDYKEEKCDWFPLFTDIYIKEHTNDNDKNELEYDINGITRNYHGKGAFALYTHGNKAGKLLYAEGIRLYSADQSEILKDYDFSKKATPEEFIDLLKERQDIDLKKGGNTRDDPFYLICCHALQKGVDSAAQRLADCTERAIYAHSTGLILADSIECMSDYEHRKTAIPMLSLSDTFGVFSDNELYRVTFSNLNRTVDRHRDRDVRKFPKTIVYPKSKLISLKKNRSIRPSLKNDGLR